MPNAVNVGEIAQVAIIERWGWWMAALKDPSKIGNVPELLIHPGESQVGYYRTRFKDSQWVPVGIYPDDDGVIVAFRDGKAVDDIPELFLWSCRNPITYDAYCKAIDGQGFDDEPPMATIGDNSGSDDPFEALNAEYLGEKELADEFIKQPVTTQAAADKVAIWAKRLTAIKSRAEGFHKVEKQPHLDAGRQVDDKWRDLKTEPDELAKKLKAHTQPFLSAQKRAEEARAAAAVAEAARLRKAADDAALAARRAEEARPADGDQEAAADRNAQAEAQRAELLRQAQEAEMASEVRNASAGRTGAKVSLRTDRRARVTDYHAAAKAMLDMNHADLKTTIDQLAQRAVKAGVTLAGVEVDEIEKVA